MKTRVWRRLILVFVGFAVFVSPAQQSGQSGSAQTPTSSASSTMMFAEVIAQQGHGLPLRQLTKEDFRLYNDRHEAQVAWFRSGARFEARPIALWLTVLCNEGGKFAGSREFSGKEALFRPALDQLDKRDTVGVAHWCDNGDAQLDLLPTKDRDQAISVLQKTIQPISFNMGANSHLVGEEAFERAVRLILRDSRERDTQALPVIVFLYGGSGSHQKDNLDFLIDDISTNLAIVFGIQDEVDLTNLTERNGQQGHFINYMIEQSGGQYLTTTPKGYAAALVMILMQLHFRYELGFEPGKVGQGRHEIKVELTKEASERYKGARLRYCAEFVAPSGEAKGP